MNKEKYFGTGAKYLGWQDKVPEKMGRPAYRRPIELEGNSEA